MDAIKRTARAITSKPVQRAVINTVLLASGAISLLCLAAVASILFFQNFVPDQFVTTPIYLQYGSSSNPYGIAPLPVALLKSQQDYDISVTLSLPRSPANTERGNFMISLYLLGSTSTDTLEMNARKLADRQADFEQSILFHSRRPTLFPYVDPVVSLASRLLFLFYHMLVPSAQSCRMIVPLAERVVFDTDFSIPGSAYVEIEAGQGIQIYDIALTMTAQLHGLRWLMFHYRAPTFVAFTSIFWACELLFMSVAWTVLISTMGSSTPEVRRTKGRRRQQRDDDDDESDDEDGQDEMSGDEQTESPIQYDPDVKKEEEEELNLADIPMMGAEADNEEEDKNTARGGRGTGTAYREQESSSMRRRASRNLH